MHGLNDEIKNISLVKILLLIVLSYLAISFLNVFNISISTYWVNIILIFYFVYLLRNCKDELYYDISNIFSRVSLKLILLIVFANIFFSYGMLYLANFLITIPSFKNLITFNFISKASLVLVGGYLSKLIIAPLCEEMLFRGIFLNKLKRIVPLSFAVLISSILFGAVHGYGSMISAVVFALCMCILYLKSGNILVPIFAHFLNNLFAESIFALDCNMVIFNNWPVMFFISLLAIISFILIMFFIVDELKNLNNNGYIT